MRGDRRYGVIQLCEWGPRFDAEGTVKNVAAIQVDQSESPDDLEAERDERHPLRQSQGFITTIAMQMRAPAWVAEDPIATGQPHGDEQPIAADPQREPAEHQNRLR